MLHMSCLIVEESGQLGRVTCRCSFNSGHTGLPGFQSCYSPGHDAYSCTLNRHLVKRPRSRLNGVKSNPAQQPTVGATNLDPATIAMLRTAIMGQQPTPTAPTATSPSPSANPAPSSTANAGQFQQDIMRIFSHILPGHTEAQAVYDKYTPLPPSPSSSATIQQLQSSSTATTHSPSTPVLKSHSATCRTTSDVLQHTKPPNCLLQSAEENSVTLATATSPSVTAATASST